MKVSCFLILLFIGWINQGFAAEEVENDASLRIADKMDADIDIINLNEGLENTEKNRKLQSSCPKCTKKYLYTTSTSYKYPLLHSSWYTSKGCKWACCTDTRNDPRCFKVYCPYTCKYNYVISACPSGYKKARGSQWKYSYYIGSKKPWGYKAGLWYKKTQCFTGCCTSDYKTGAGCCIKS
jgi:hypothetical protein